MKVNNAHFSKREERSTKIMEATLKQLHGKSAMPCRMDCVKFRLVYDKI